MWVSARRTFWALTGNQETCPPCTVKWRRCRTDTPNYWSSKASSSSRPRPSEYLETKKAVWKQRIKVAGLQALSLWSRAMWSKRIYPPSFLKKNYITDCGLQPTKTLVFSAAGTTTGPTATVGSPRPSTLTGTTRTTLTRNFPSATPALPLRWVFLSSSSPHNQDNCFCLFYFS